MHDDNNQVGWKSGPAKVRPASPVAPPRDLAYLCEAQNHFDDSTLACEGVWGPLPSGEFRTSDICSLFRHCMIHGTDHMLPGSLSVSYTSLLCSIIPLVSLLFAVLVSLHPATFLMFFITCITTSCAIQDCIQCLNVIPCMHD